MTPTQEHRCLYSAFRDSGYNLWFVGGCVRDWMNGQEPKDIDMCTDATPEEQAHVYQTHNIKYFETGLQHGTLTAVVNHVPFEITTLRTESNHDGRHADVSYTRDLKEDLGRRDLTINAMAMGFDGVLYDPFNGADDLQNKRIRFVGDAEERLKEDYLRILRFFRFKDRYAPFEKIDYETASAIMNAKDGLKQISAERIWQEMKKLLMSGYATYTLTDMRALGISTIIGLPFFSEYDIGLCQQLGVEDPCSLIGYALLPEEVRELANKWKWSNTEKDRALFIAKNRDVSAMSTLKNMLIDGIPLEWVLDLASMQLLDRDELKDWVVPEFPINGHDLMKLGFKGPQIGFQMKRLKDVWKMLEYNMTRQSLLLMAQQN